MGTRQTYLEKAHIELLEQLLVLMSLPYRVAEAQAVGPPQFVHQEAESLASAGWLGLAQRAWSLAAHYQPEARGWWQEAEATQDHATRCPLHPPRS